MKIDDAADALNALFKDLLKDVGCKKTFSEFNKMNKEETKITNVTIFCSKCLKSRPLKQAVEEGDCCESNLPLLQ